MRDQAGTLYATRAVHPRRGIINTAFEGLSQLDSLAPDQYFNIMKRSELAPEKQLVLAVLEDAVHCFQKYFFATYVKERTLSRDAEEWFFESVEDGLFSFESVCDILGLDSSYVRKGLITWRDAERAKFAEEDRSRGRCRR